MYGCLYIWQPGGSELLLVLTHFLFAMFALLGAVLAWRASRMFKPGVAARRVWILQSAGLTMLTVSESLWLIFYIVHQPLPYPSVVDVSWGIGFVPILAGLVLQYRALNVRLSRRRQLSILAIYLGVLCAGFISMLAYTLSQPGELAVMQLLVGAYYLVGNLGVVFIATMSLVYLGTGLVARPWIYMVIGILAFSIAGLAFSYGTWTGAYVTGSNALSLVVDVAYLAGYALIAAGGYRQVTLHLQALKDQPPEPTRASREV
jgi:hypothetical protein